MSEAGWTVGFLICEKGLGGRNKGYLVLLWIRPKLFFYLFFFNFPRTGKQGNISFLQAQHAKLPAENNLTAPSSCSVKSTFSVLSCLSIAHLGFPGSCRGSQSHSSPAHLACSCPVSPAPGPPRLPGPHSPAWGLPSHSCPSTHTPAALGTAGGPSWVQLGLSSLSALEEKQGEPQGLWLSQGSALGEPQSTTAGSGDPVHLTESLFNMNVCRETFLIQQKSTSSQASGMHGWLLQNKRNGSGRQTSCKISLTFTLFVSSQSHFPWRQIYGHGEEKYILFFIVALAVEKTSTEGNGSSVQDSRVQFIPAWKNLSLIS